MKGTLFASLWENLDCTLTLPTRTYSRHYYEERITDLQGKIEKLKPELDKVTKEFNDKSGDQKKFEAQLEAYREQLVDIDKKLEELKLEYIIL